MAIEGGAEVEARVFASDGAATAEAATIEGLEVGPVLAAVDAATRVLVRPVQRDGASGRGRSRTLLLPLFHLPTGTLSCPRRLLISGISPSPHRINNNNNNHGLSNPNSLQCYTLCPLYPLPLHPKTVLAFQYHQVPGAFLNHINHAMVSKGLRCPQIHMDSPLHHGEPPAGTMAVEAGGSDYICMIYMTRVDLLERCIQCNSRLLLS